jgi:hypothetical protein
MVIRRTNKHKLWHAGEIEIAIAKHLNPRQNLIVPNVFWGWGNYEKDLVVVTSNHYAWEIEIKVSLADLKKDNNKRHGHYNNKIKRLYFAVPDKLKQEALKLIPERAGLFTVSEDSSGGLTFVSLVRAPTINSRAEKIEDKDITKLYELAAMRIWDLKTHLYRLQVELTMATTTTRKKEGW